MRGFDHCSTVRLGKSACSMVCRSQSWRYLRFLRSNDQGVLKTEGCFFVFFPRWCRWCYFCRGHRRATNAKSWSLSVSNSRMAILVVMSILSDASPFSRWHQRKNCWCRFTRAPPKSAQASFSWPGTSRAIPMLLSSTSITITISTTGPPCEWPLLYSEVNSNRAYTAFWKHPFL